MDLVNYVLILRKTHLWICRHKDIKPSIVTLKTFVKTNTKLKNILLSNLIEEFLSVINRNPIKNSFYVAIINFLLLVTYMELPWEQCNSQTHVKITHTSNLISGNK